MDDYINQKGVRVESRSPLFSVALVVVGRLADRETVTELVEKQVGSAGDFGNR